MLLQLDGRFLTWIYKMAVSNKEIGIYYVPGDGCQWAQFLQHNLNSYDVKSTLIDITSSNETKPTNVILVSPAFFTLPSLLPLQSIDPQRSLFVLLGTDAVEVQSFLVANKLSSILKDITLFETEATENCVKELIIGIIKLYEHSYGDDEPYDTLPAPRPSADLGEQNDIYQVAISQTDNEREVILLCNRKMADEINVEISDENGQRTTQVKATHENKAVYKFSIEKNIKANRLSFVAKDGSVTIGTGVVNLQTVQSHGAEHNHLSRLETLRQILGEEEDPLCLMCQALNIQEKTKQALDQNLANKCRSLDVLRKFGESFFENIPATSSGHSTEVWPTLLHFAAEYDLPLFCKELLAFPWSSAACHKLNKESDIPIDIAQRKHHTEIVSILKAFMSEETSNTIQCGDDLDNRDSGVVDDVCGNRCSVDSTYADMSRGRVSGSDLNETLDDAPPPTPHATKTYVNCQEPPPPCLSPPSSHESEENSENIYMDMTGRKETTTEFQVEVEPPLRTKSDNQACYYGDTEDVDNEGNEDVFDEDPIQNPSFHHSSSEPNMINKHMTHDLQLPSQSDRQSGFFKKFKLFRKNKKDKADKQRKHDRSMSVPNVTGLAGSQQEQYNQKVFGRAAKQPHPCIFNRDSSSSTSSCDSKDVETLTLVTLEEPKSRNRGQHFLHKDNRKSIRISKALNDHNSPTPPTLPERTHHNSAPPPTLPDRTHYNSPTPPTLPARTNYHL